MDDLEWHEHVKGATERALRSLREDLNANPPYDNDVPYWPGSIINALIWEPPRMALWQHAQLLDKAAAGYRAIGADGLAREFEVRAQQVRSDRTGRW